jgi:hypothetical protein
MLITSKNKIYYPNNKQPMEYITVGKIVF